MTRVRYVTKYAGELDQKRCSYISFTNSITCKIGENSKFLELPIDKDEAKISYFNFKASKFQEYRNNTIVGCHGDARNVYCEFFDPFSNSSSLFTIEGIKPLLFLGGYDDSIIPISDAQVVSVSLTNNTIRFYDLENSGKYLGSYPPAPLKPAFSFYRPVFSSSSFQLSWQTNLNSLVMLKIEPRFSIQNCQFHIFSQGKCA